MKKLEELFVVRGEIESALDCGMLMMENLDNGFARKTLSILGGSKFVEANLRLQKMIERERDPELKTKIHTVVECMGIAFFELEEYRMTKEEFGWDHKTAYDRFLFNKRRAIENMNEIIRASITTFDKEF